MCNKNSVKKISLPKVNTQEKNRLCLLISLQTVNPRTVLSWLHTLEKTKWPCRNVPSGLIWNVWLGIGCGNVPGECAQANAFDLMRAARAAEVIPDVLAREMIYGVDGVFTKEPSLYVCVLSLFCMASMCALIMISSILPLMMFVHQRERERERKVSGRKLRSASPQHTRTPIIKLAWWCIAFWHIYIYTKQRPQHNQCPASDAW